MVEKTKEQRKKKQEVWIQRRVHTKNEAEVKKWQRQFSKGAQTNNFLGDKEMKETSWEEGSQEKWDQEQKVSRKN